MSTWGDNATLSTDNAKTPEGTQEPAYLVRIGRVAGPKRGQGATIEVFHRLVQRTRLFKIPANTNVQLYTLNMFF